MKEIGTFKIDKNMCSNCREDGNCPQEYSVIGNCLHTEKDLIIEKVPENFSELKELCKGLENVSIHDVGGYIKLSINGNLIYFFIAGEMEGKIDITNNTFLERFCVIQKATPSQMWQIIKNLIGEE